jgi:hypothetical protein
MTFSLEGVVVRWPDGSEGVIRQTGLSLDRSRGDRAARIADLTIERRGQPPLVGHLRFTAEAHERFPGADDAEKAGAVARRLIGLVAAHGLQDGFFLRVDADDSGVQIVDASR